MRRRSTLSNVVSTLVGLAAVVSLAGNAYADVLDDVKTNGTLKCGVTLASAWSTAKSCGSRSVQLSVEITPGTLNRSV